MKKITKLLLLNFGILLFGSCNLIHKENFTGLSAVTITITEPGISATAAYTRSAIPTLENENEIFYKIVAISENKEVTAESQSGKKVILFIEEGSWKIKIYGFINSQKNEDFENAILFGEKTIHVDGNGEFQVEIPLYFIQQGEGSVNLEIDVSSTNISMLTIGGTNSSLDGNYFVDENGIIKIQKEEVAANTYDSVLSFFEFHNENESPTYTQILGIQEKINVRKNLITKNWIKSGNTPYFISQNEEDTAFVLTPVIISKMVNSTFYVSSGNSEKNLLTAENGISDSNSGSRFAPFQNIQAAINKIQSLANNSLEETNFTIFIDGPLENQECIFCTNNDYPIEVSIKPLKNSQGFTNASITGKSNKFFEIHKNFQLNLCDINLNKGDVILTEEATVILTGETKLTDGNFILSDNSHLLLNEIDSEKTEILGKIKLEKPEEGQILVEGINNSPLTQGIIRRFKLNNPGYYLALDENFQKGIVKASYISIKIPNLNSCNLKLNAKGEQNINFKENHFEILQNFLIQPNITAENTIFSVEIESPYKNLENNPLFIPAKDISIQLLCDSNVILRENSPSENSNERTLTIPEGFIYPGKYILQIQYIFDDITYDSKTLVEIL